MIQQDPNHKSAASSQVLIITDSESDETIATFEETEGLYIPEAGSRITLRQIVDESPEKEGYETKAYNLYEVDNVGSDYSLVQFKNDDDEWVDKIYNYVHILVTEVEKTD